MREVKFRGKSKYPLAKGDNWITSSDVYINYEDELAFLDAIEVYFESVGQFTGLKDKNGKDIYEGNICETGTTDEVDNVDVVKFKNGSFQFFDIEGDLGPINVGDKYMVTVEVVGNIYEHSHLLEADTP